MNEQIKRFLGRVKQFWSGVSKQNKGLIIGGIVVLLVGALAITILLNTKNYVPIFEDLSTAENNEILAQLESMNYNVKLDSSGAILAPKADESKIRMELATAGYPKNGLSYYVVEDNNSLLSTDYERKQYENMQLQERIGASIKTLQGVKEAVVTISAPAENVFYLQEEEKPTASVIIHMYPGNVLTENQVLGIQNLVAKSFSGLSKDDIALLDGEGNDLISRTAGSSGDFSKIKLTREIENDIKKKVNDVLDGPYDQSKYNISVSATVNTDALKKETTVYMPSEAGDNTGVVNEETWGLGIAGGTNADGGIAGTSSNSEVTTYAEGVLENGGIVTDTSGNRSYSVSEDKTQTERMDPVVESVSIGIALNDLNLNPTERENLIQLVAFSAGVTPESVAVRNFDFYAEDEEVEKIPENLNKMLIYGGLIGGAFLLLLVLIMIIVVAFKKKKNRGKRGLNSSSSFDEEDPMEELFGNVDPNLPIQPIKDNKKEKIKEFATTNPEIAAQLFKSWLKNESE